MVSKPGMSKNDVKHMRKFNDKVFREREDLAKNLQHKDIENPSLRAAIGESPLSKKFSAYQLKELHDASHHKEFTKVERLALKYGATSDEASHLSAVARAE